MKNLLKILLTLATIILFGYAIYYLRTILLYLLLAAIFALLGKPLMDVLLKMRYKRIRIPRGICGLLTIMSFYLIIFGFIGLFLPLLIEEVQLLLELDFQILVNEFAKPIDWLDELLRKYRLQNNGLSLRETIVQEASNFFSIENFTTIFGTFFAALGVFGNVVIAIFSITFITFFFLTDRALIYNFIRYVIPTNFEKSFNHVIYTTRTLLTRYFVGILIQVTLISTLVTIGMAIIGIRYPLLIGFFAGVINIIPYLGPIIGMAFGVFVGITTGIVDYPFYEVVLPQIFQIILVFVVVQFLDNSFFQPYIFSNSIKAHPLEIFLLILVAATLAGIPGMILGIPCYTIIRVMSLEVLHEMNIIKLPLRE